MFVVAKIYRERLMGVTGLFGSNSEARTWASQKNSKLKHTSETYYQVWPIKEKRRAKTTSRKKAKSKRTSKA